MTLDSLSKRYAKRPSEFVPFPEGTTERERLAYDIGIYYWARGEDAKDEWWRRVKPSKAQA